MLLKDRVFFWKGRGCVICDIIGILIICWSLIVWNDPDVADIIKLAAMVPISPAIVWCVLNLTSSVGLLVILRHSLTKEEFTVYCYLVHSKANQLIENGMDEDFVREANDKITAIANRHSFFSLADGRDGHRTEFF